ncbi:hypothetical protein [Clostridium beijerinckii]|uniref:hypothetical protein n=1 Tax=Clostridium beijerinckii TaxID=1520 RepID=UPI001F316679|nr:hypothetical protein [Clostridium beijerinckii]
MNDLVKTQEKYYKNIFNDNGIGVKSYIYQELRFDKIYEFLKDEENLSIHDLGMGNGSLFEYLNNRFHKKQIDYSGSEIVEELYLNCKNTYKNNTFYLRTIDEFNKEEKYDYLIMCGIFNTKQECEYNSWKEYMFETISKAFEFSEKGIIFNCLTEFCDFYDEKLFYCNINELLNYINNNLSRFFIINHSYPLYELTVCVYKEDYIRYKYKDEKYKKYFSIQR